MPSPAQRLSSIPNATSQLEWDPASSLRLSAPQGAPYSSPEQSLARHSLATITAPAGTRLEFSPLAAIPRVGATTYTAQLQGGGVAVGPSISVASGIPTVTILQSASNSWLETAEVNGATVQGAAMTRTYTVRGNYAAIGAVAKVLKAGTILNLTNSRAGASVFPHLRPKRRGTYR